MALHCRWLSWHGQVAVMAHWLSLAGELVSQLLSSVLLRLVAMPLVATCMIGACVMLLLLLVSGVWVSILICFCFCLFLFLFLFLFLHEVVQSDCQFQSQDCLPGVALSLCLAALPFVLQGTGLPTINQLGPDAVAAWLACRGLGLLRGPSASDCRKSSCNLLVLVPCRHSTRGWHW